MSEQHMAPPTTALLLLDAADITTGSDGESLDAYVQQLRECLCGWDPATGLKSLAMRDFVDALTEIAALPLDAMSMEVRRLLVDGPDEDTSDTTIATAAIGSSSGNASTADTSTRAALVAPDSDEDNNSDDNDIDRSSTPVARILAALGSRDVLLKCKAANALGSLCISRVAGQHLLDQYGAVALARLVRMATCKHRWAQADAFFVLGWVVVIADDAMVQQIARLVPTVVRFLRESVTVRPASDATDAPSTPSAARRSRKTALSSEDASNFRVYAVVLLLNCLQRDASMFANADQLRELVETLHAVVKTLNAHSLSATASSSLLSAAAPPSVLETTEFVEMVRLIVTFTSVLVDQVAPTASLVLACKMLPALLRLRQVLVHAAGLLQRSSDSISEATIDDESEAADLMARMDAIVATVLASR